MPKRIAIYCSSSDNAPVLYRDCARDFTRQIVGRGYGIVYGGGYSGLMGVVAREALAMGAEVIGVIPQFMVKRKWVFNDVADLRFTPDMQSRKTLMVDLCDMIAVLPGGVGTMDEFFEALDDRLLGLHKKHIILVNVGGCYDDLLQMLSKMCTDYMLAKNYTKILTVVNYPFVEGVDILARPDTDISTYDTTDCGVPISGGDES